MGGTDTWSSVLHRFVTDRELPEIMTNHFRPNLHLVEALAVVHAHHAADHFGDDYHIPQVCPHWGWFLPRRGVLFSFPQFFDESQGLPLQTTLESPPGAGVEQLHQILHVHVQELVQVDSTIGELPESPFLRCSRIL